MSIIQCSKVQPYRESQRPFPQIFKYRRPKSSHVSIFCQLYRGKTLQSFLFTFYCVFSITENNFSPNKGSENFGHRYLRLCGTSIRFYPAIVKFMFSKKTTKIDEIFTIDLTLIYIPSNRWWRFCQFLWPF
jgi:hypothetical protein